ncbi:MAG TPA: site-specific DNA-methyltransferase [Candidatus Acidoferrales bacterium]|nr:site-specific DNA-methyltransferase [Candidatus Acidoferrales bacterium]
MGVASDKVFADLEQQRCHFGKPNNHPLPGRIYEADCLQELSSWPDASVDCCITDPPYNMSKKKGLGWAYSKHVTMQEKWDIFSKDEYASFTRDWLKSVCRVVKPNGNLLIFGSFHNIYLIGFVLQNLLERRILQQVTWFKPNAQPNITGRLLTESTEFVIWAVNAPPEEAKGWTFNYADAKLFNAGKQLRNMWTIPYTPASEKQLGTHPTQKPIALLMRMVKIWTRPEDVVLDCFLGTGTTAVACEALGRKWVGIEKDEKYVVITQRRLAGVQRELAKGALSAAAP